MKIDRVISVLALVTATVALLIALGIGRADPYGKSLDEYDISNPQAALQTMQKIATERNFRAGISYFVDFLLADEENSQLAFFRNDATDIKVVKSFEIQNSGEKNNNGKITLFVQYKVKGVEYRQVFFFMQHQGKFYPTGDFYAPYSDENKTDSDKQYAEMIKKFKDSGKID